MGEMEPIQRIVITVFPDGSYGIDHKHRDFTKESYVAQSREGLVAAVYNLLYGFQPNRNDLHRKPVQRSGITINELPRLLD